AHLGFADGRSVLQSGNLLFRGRGRPTAELERVLEKEFERRHGPPPDFLVRTADEWEAVVAQNPFPNEARRDPGRLTVVFLKTAPQATNVAALQNAIVGREIVRADGRHAYIVYPDGIGRSRLTHTLIEKTLGTRGTARNWNTVLKLSTLAKS